MEGIQGKGRLARGHLAISKVRIGEWGKLSSGLGFQGPQEQRADNTAVMGSHMDTLLY